MDPITHGLLGGVLVKAVRRKQATTRLTAAGALGAMAPDLDLLIHSRRDPLLIFEYHRQFTHSLAFIPVGGAIVGLLLWALWGRRFPLKPILFAATLGFASHGLLDACTSYGTLLLWPFSSRRISWDLISIVDPAYTAILLLGLWLAGRRPGGWAARLALGLSCLYLSLGGLQHRRALELQSEIAQARGEALEHRRALPTLGNLLLWRSLYVAQGKIYVDALRLGMGDARYWVGGSLPLFSPEGLSPRLAPESVLARDLRTFDWFTDGYMALLNPRPLEVGDLRFTASPDGLQPLWGVRVDPEYPDRHLSRLHTRWARREGLRTLREMLLGTAPGAQNPRSKTPKDSALPLTPRYGMKSL